MEENLFGDILKKLREAAGIGSRELSRKVGMTDAYVSQLERGAIKKPNYFTALNLLKNLSVSAEEREGILKRCNIPSPNLPQDVSGALTDDSDIDLMDWFMEKRKELSQIPLRLNITLNTFIERDFSKAEQLLKSIDELIKIKNGSFNFFVELLSLNYMDLTSDQREKIINFIKSEITSNDKTKQ